MCTIDLPKEVFWGKLKKNQDGEISGYLPLTHHCIDVAVVFRQLLRQSAIQRSFDIAAGEALTSAQLDRLAVIALLHDFGKANLGFQDKVFDQKAPQAGHIVETVPVFVLPSLFEQLSDAIDYPKLSTWFAEEETLQAYLLATLSHHGRPINVEIFENERSHKKERFWQKREARDPFHAIAEIVSAAKMAFPVAFADDIPAIPSSPPLQHRFAGLLMLADWLGSSELFFPIDNGISDRLSEAPDLAKRVISAVGLNVQCYQQSLRRADYRFKALFDFDPYPLQKALDQLPTDHHDNRLLIAEAETGSGKTEAALIRFFRLFAVGEVDGLYFALPTRVAARELYERVLARVKKAFPDSKTRPIVLLAVPGYTQVDGVKNAVLPHREGRCFDEREQRSWASEHPKRFLAATIAVGTIDQALLSALQSPHAHLRSVCLDRQLLVVDEVHASDVYMQTLLSLLLEHHLQRSHALLLSATLGSAAQQVYIQAAGGDVAQASLEKAMEVSYPSLFNGRGHNLLANVQQGEQKKLTVQCLPELDQLETLLPIIAEALQKGARILVVLNTVGRAIALQRAVEKEPSIDPSILFICREIITPHHGRYCPADREHLDKAVTDCLGKDSLAGARLLIGTQTLEQSLDIDADLLITDLCPMDVLLQRIGRLFRHQRQRPEGMEKARCIVLTPDGDSLLELLSDNGEASGAAKRCGLGSVYSDLRIIQLTWDCLRENSELSIPKDNRYLVEKTTHPEALQQLQEARWHEHGHKVFGDDICQGNRADFASLIPLYQQPFGEVKFDELNEKARTRLGIGALRLTLPQSVTSPFGVQITEVVIPGHMAPAGQDQTITQLSQTDFGFTFQLGNKLYQYSRYGLEVINEPTH